MTREIDSNEFKEETSTGTVVIKTTAAWCSTCKAIQPAVDKLAEANPDVKFLKIDADAHTDFVVELGIRKLPTFLFYKDGALMETLLAPTAIDLKKKVEALKQGS